MASGVTSLGPVSPISKLLIANRGEIAVRVAATARRLGMTAIGVFSDADRDAQHVRSVDVAVALGGHSPAESYLRGEAIIAAAQRCGADAIHPGYGFLAENAEFAEAVQAAGLIWVGPSPDQIRLLGDKIAAKSAAVAAGVTTSAAVTVDTDGSYDRAALPTPPLLVKAAAGGGGRGMRVVTDLDELDDAITAAQRESQAAFGDGTVFIEPFIARGHHVEVQIFGDQHGNVVDLGERECSIQRRNQKIIEESPSPSIGTELRTRLRADAVALARQVGYIGAGTVEFLVADDAAGASLDPGSDLESGSVSFLEVNTRLQVEHPVTEAVTGYDLVEWQLDVAAGRPLPATQAEIDDRLAIGLHAIEARVVAEDPTTGWLPSTGRIHRFRIPDDSVRVDSGVGTGSEITPDYDSLLAKVIAVGPSRRVAAGRLASDLRRAVVAGVDTNLAMLAATLEERDFLAGATTTAYLDDHPIQRLDGDIIDRLVIAATIAEAARQRGYDDVTGFAPSGWRNLATIGQRRIWRSGGVEYPIEYRPDGRTGSAERWTVSLGAFPDVDADGSLVTDTRPALAVTSDVSSLGDDSVVVVVEIDGVRSPVDVFVDGGLLSASSSAGTIVLELVPRFVDHDLEAVGGGPICPLPGTVISVVVSDGDRVEAGAVLMVVEAMKMEHQITAPTDSIVDRVRFAVGDRVDAGDLLVELSPLGENESEGTGER